MVFMIGLGRDGRLFWTTGKGWCCAPWPCVERTSVRWCEQVDRQGPLPSDPKAFQGMAYRKNRVLKLLHSLGPYWQ